MKIVNNFVNNLSSTMLAKDTISQDNHLCKDTTSQDKQLCKDTTYNLTKFIYLNKCRVTHTSMSARITIESYHRLCFHLQAVQYIVLQANRLGESHKGMTQTIATCRTESRQS